MWPFKRSSPAPEARPSLEDAEYDFVIVGSGPGGGPLACELALAGHAVCLIDAGKDDTDDEVTRIPGQHLASSEDDHCSWKFFVKHYTDPARQRLDPKFVEEKKGIFYPRCSSLGGCSVHNALICHYPGPEQWRMLVEITQDEKYDPDNMRRLWETKIEKKEKSAVGRVMDGMRGNPGRFGYKGWLATQTPAAEIAYAEAASQAFDWPKLKMQADLREMFSTDANDWRFSIDRKEGFSLVTSTTRNGERASVRDFVHDTMAKTKSLSLALSCFATKVIFDTSGERPKALGVEVLQCPDGVQIYRASVRAGSAAELPKKRILARKEVIVASGAFNTPQLLMLSGVGPKADLEKFRIPVIVDAPGVGTNLQDRYEIPVISGLVGGKNGFPDPAERPAPANELATAAELHYERVFTETAIKQWRSDRAGNATWNGVAFGAIKRSDASHYQPDLFLFGSLFNFHGYFPGYSKIENIQYGQKWTWAILKANTKNKAGRVTLRSADPFEPPDINFRYFDDDPSVPPEVWQNDLRATVNGIKMCRQLSANLSEFLGVDNLKELHPGFDRCPEGDDAALGKYVMENSWGHHASCSCPMGPPEEMMSPSTPLDPQCRVKGVDGLRVVDASSFTSIPGMFIVTSVYLLSHKIAEDIIAQYA